MLIKIKALLLISVMIFSVEISQAASARSSAITLWDGNCSGGTRSWWDDMCMKWRKRMGSNGWSQWWRNYSLVKVDRFTDSTVAAYGNDHTNIDGGDAALLCTHGGWDDDGWWGLMHTRQFGWCGIKQKNMRLGKTNGKLRFWHMSSCNSVRWSKRLKWFTAAGHKVHVVTGFHGWMYIGSKYVNEYRELAKHAFSSKGVGRVWMDKMHHVDHWYNGWKTICPISLGFGSTSAQAANAHNEKYKWKYSDKTNNWMNWRYYRRCDPNGGPRLPN